MTNPPPSRSIQARAGDPHAGGIPEILEDGVGAHLVAPGDAEALGNSIAWVLSNAADARAMAHVAQARVRASFTKEAMVAGTLAQYKRLLVERATASR